MKFIPLILVLPFSSNLKETRIPSLTLSKIFKILKPSQEIWRIDTCCLIAVQFIIRIKLLLT